MQYSDLVERIDVPGSKAWLVNTEAQKRKRNGEDVIVLAIGDHEFDTSEQIVSAGIESLNRGRHHYTPAAGERHLKQAVVDFHRRVNKHTITPANVVIVPGAQCGLFTTCMCLFNPGDEVIVPDPMYSTYEGTIHCSGATVKPLKLRAELDFQLEPDDLAGAVGPNTKGLFLNTPHNPSGAVLRQDTMKEITALCKENDVWIVSDEVYATMTFDVPHVSPSVFPGMLERTVVIASMSKSYAMTGWRLGWCITDKITAHNIELLLGNVLFGVAPFVQDAAAKALQDESIPAEITAVYRRRRDFVLQRLQQVPNLKFHKPDGAMYLMIDIRPTGLDSEDFAWRLLDEQKVGVLPGEGFGPGGAGHIRLSLSASDKDIARACDRIEVFVNSLI